MKKLIYLSLLLIVLAGCEKEGTLVQLDGTYTGTFRTMVNNKEQITEFEVTLDSKRFTTIKGGAGRGTFELLSKEKIKFTDELFYTANFDWSTLLNGNYTYEVKGDSLILNKTLENPVKDNYYQYRLKKTK